MRRPEGMEAGGPERLIGVDVADPRNERLIDQERLQSPLACSESLAEEGQRERVGQWLGPDRRERVVGRDIEADPAELADVAKPDLATIVELEDEPDVWIGEPALPDDEQLAGHLEVDRQERLAGQLDDDLLAPP